MLYPMPKKSHNRTQFSACVPFSNANTSSSRIPFKFLSERDACASQLPSPTVGNRLPLGIMNLASGCDSVISRSWVSDVTSTYVFVFAIALDITLEFAWRVSWCMNPSLLSALLREDVAVWVVLRTNMGCDVAAWWVEAVMLGARKPRVMSNETFIMKLCINDRLGNVVAAWPFLGMTELNKIS